MSQDKPTVMKDMKEENYEDINILLGFGNFQHFQIWVFQTLLAILGAINYFHIVFIVSEPPEWGCLKMSGEYSEADRCDVNGTACVGAEIVYNSTHRNYLDSLVVQHNWVCSKSLWGANVISATAIGSLFHCLIFGQLSDRLGRAAVMHITNIIFIVTRVISFHVTDHYVVFLVLSAVGTSFFPVGVRAGYTLVAEYCDDAGRKYAFISGWVWWVFGMVIVPFIAEWLNDWYTFGMVTTLSNLLIVGLLPFVPESPRLLIKQMKFKRAAEVISRIRRWNSAEQIDNLEGILKNIHKQWGDADELGVLSLFREMSLRRVFACMTVLFCVNDYFYFAGQLNSHSLAGSMFVNHALLALTELPSVFIGQFLIDRFGRRWSHVFFMTLTTVSFVVNVIVAETEGAESAVTVFSIIARTASNVAWFIMWVQAIEVFPTALRNTGINLSVVMSICMSMTSPYVINLNNIDKRLPYIVFVVLGVIGIIGTSFVPETKGVSLPETVQQLDNMFRDMRFFELRPWTRNNKQDTTAIQQDTSIL